VRTSQLCAPVSTIFKRASTGYVTLDRLLRRLFRNKEGLAFSNARNPINTNASENDIAPSSQKKFRGTSGKRRDAATSCWPRKPV